MTDIRMLRKPHPPTCPNHPYTQGGVRTLALHADGRRAVSGGGLYDATLRVWDLDTGECLRVLKGRTLLEVNSVAVCPDGRHAVSGGDSMGWFLRDKLRVWDLDTGKCLRVLKGHTWEVHSVAVYADGNRAVSATGGYGGDHTLRLWDLNTGNCLRVLEGHTWEVTSVAVCPDGHRVVSGSNDRTLRIWDLDTGACLHVLKGHTGFVRSVALCADGRAISGGDDNALRAWDLNTGQCLGIWFGASHFTALALGPLPAHGCTRIVAGGWDGSVNFFELMPPGTLTRATLATWSPTAALLATTFDTGVITLQQWHTSSAQLEPLARYTRTGAPISSLSFSLDGTRLQVLTTDNTERILDATTLQPASPPTCAWADPRDISPDGRWREVIRDGRLVVKPVKV